MALQCDVSYIVFNRMDNLAIVIMQQVAAVQITPRSAWGLTQTPNNNLQNFKADLCRHHIKSVKAGGR